MTTWKNPQTWVCGFFYKGKRIIQFLYLKKAKIVSIGPYASLFSEPQMGVTVKVFHKFH